MGTHSGAGVAGALFGRTRLSVLNLLFSQPGRSAYVREIVRETGAGMGAVQRELRNLEQAGLLSSHRDGAQVYYRACTENPVFGEIQGLLAKTTGVVSVIRDALTPLAGSIRVAFVYGSHAQGTARADSDVDVLVVGEVSFRDVCAALASAGRTLGREVNACTFSGPEIRERIASGDHFVTHVLKQRKLFAIGGPDELDRLAE